MANLQVPKENKRVYVIGDIHGRLDLLDRLIADIARDAKGQEENALTVTLGDYIDRGPNTRGVLDRLVGHPFPGDYVALKGNHEAILQTFLDNPAILDEWRRLGGLETLQSFDIPIAPLMRGKDYVEAAEQMRDALSQEQTKFLASLEMSLTIGPYFLCHAGIRPAVSLERQNPADLLWIRDEFLTSTMDFGKIVVHGHTPTEQPEVLPNRINIDTGAYASGHLTCLILEGGKRRFMTT
jgi:serine/threonine protein phosphatase 1